MADLSSYTAVFVRQAGNDATADGSIGLPYATAQAAFAATYALLDGATNYVLDFDSGSFGGVNLTAASAAEWPQAIAVRGVSSAASLLEGISAAGTVSSGVPTAGKPVTVVSNQTINLGAINSSGGNADAGVDGGNGGNVILTDCICDAIASNGGAGGQDYSTVGNGGDGGLIMLTNTRSGAISAKGGVSAATGGNGGDVFLTDSVADGTIDNYGGSGATIGGDGGDCAIQNSRCGNIDSGGGVLDANPPGVIGTATFSGYSILPNIIRATVYASNLKQGRGVNGSAMLGIV